MRTALEAQTRLEAGQWSDAAKTAARLPKPEFTLTWDDSQVPQVRRAEFALARDAAIEMWTRNLRGLQVRIGRGSDVVISFTETLPPSADSPGPAGATFIRGVGPDELRVDAVVAMFRGENRVPVTPREVHNEVLFAIGTYLGLERAPTPHTVMGRHEGPYSVSHQLSGRELNLARQLLGISETLREMAVQRVRITAAKPRLAVDPALFERPPVLEGEVIPFSVQLVNHGNAPLNVTVIPDCRCLIVSGASRTIEPGQTVAVPVRLDTTNFPGPLDSSLYVYSNDPEEPLRRVRARVNVTPRYRFLRTDPGRVLVVPDNGLKTEVFLAFPKELATKVTGVRLDGVRAMVSFEPWAGTMPDAELNEGPLPRSGYRIQILSGLEIPPGRVPATLVVQTDDPVFPVMRHTLTLQRGIAVLPGSVYLGELGNAPSTAWFLVTRPGRGFRVLDVTSDSPRLSARFEPVRGNYEYRVTLTYDGRGEFGQLAATITIRTDDPRQPEIAVPVTGLVR
jgi:hypothetical protein